MLASAAVKEFVEFVNTNDGLGMSRANGAGDYDGIATNLTGRG